MKKIFDSLKLSESFSASLVASSSNEIVNIIGMNDSCHFHNFAVSQNPSVAFRDFTATRRIKL